MAIPGLLSSNLQNSILRGERSREPNACCRVTKMFFRDLVVWVISLSGVVGHESL